MLYAVGSRHCHSHTMPASVPTASRHTLRVTVALLLLAAWLSCRAVNTGDQASLVTAVADRLRAYTAGGSLHST